MTYTIILKERRAQLVVNEMNNGTKIVTEPDHEGWVKVAVELTHDYHALALYHAGMEAKKQFDADWKSGVAI